MSKVIRVPTSVYNRLQALAEPFVDTPGTVISRLLDDHDGRGASSPSSPPSPLVADLDEREPRSRGVTVELDGQPIEAASVPDLYEQVLRFLVDEGVVGGLEGDLPIATSRKRYLLARSPVHPNGNDFVNPVAYQGYYMEAHKDYKNALRHLNKRVLAPLGIELEYLD